MQVVMLHIAICLMQETLLDEDYHVYMPSQHA